MSSSPWQPGPDSDRKHPNRITCMLGPLRVVKMCVALHMSEDFLFLLQVKQKKNAYTGELLCFQVDLNVEQLLLSLDVHQYQLCRHDLKDPTLTISCQP